MKDDNRKKNATKHYQNSEYPSGSFEAAINADHQDRLRENTGLRLERHPLAPGNSGADLEEMVPAFMHRDFFRSEEEAVPTEAPRLRIGRKESPAPITPGPQGYQEPPNTEDMPPSTQGPSLQGPSAQAPPAQAPIPQAAPTRPGVPTAVKPSPSSAEQTEAPAKPEGPLPPLRSGETPPSISDSPTRPAPTTVTYPPTVVSPKPERSATNSPYSLPMLVALALVMGIFVWREQTRPTVVAQEPLPVPQTVSVQVAPTPVMAEPTPAGTGFRPTYLAVGPPIPQDHGQEVGASPAPSGEPEGEAGLLPGGEGEQAIDEPASDEDSADRAAILEAMSQATAESPPVSSEPGDLFPVGDEEAGPVRDKAPVREAGPAPKAQPRVEVEPKAVPVAASAADLFPIDEEIPIKPGKSKNPVATAPPPQPEAPTAPPPEGYRIDEPSL